jgi:undecaprenyl-phosphate galactose phosphotransferase
MARINTIYFNVLYIFIMVLVDLSSTIISMELAHFSHEFIFHEQPIYSLVLPDSSNLIYLWWIPVIIIAVFCLKKVYTKRLPLWDAIIDLISAFTLSMVLILAIITLAKVGNQFSRITLFFMYLYGLLIYPLARIGSTRVLYKIGLWKEKVIILGAGYAGTAIAEGIIKDRHMGYHLVGFLDDDKGKIGSRKGIYGNNYKVYGSLKHYKRFIRSLGISTVIIAIPSMNIDKLSKLTSDVQRHVRNIIVVPELRGIAILNTELHHLFTQRLFMIKIRNNLHSIFNQFLKNIFDYTVSLIFLPILLPTIAIFALLIKIDSPGPVFFGHNRIGKNGKVIKVYKFRTMYRDSHERLKKILESDPLAKEEWDTFYKLKDDPRVTKVGTFLRKTSLDELAQIFNVLKGNMSLVGPRPVIKDEITKYYKENAEYYYLAKPGITGLWQVSGRNEVEYDERVSLDIWYILNWSILLDIVILLKTIRVVLMREGAY